jgi:TP901 family phage tail tape measure protein
MALGTREMLLVIRARDEASRVLGRLSSSMKDLDKGAMQAARDSMARGGALVSLGAGITAMGAAGLAYFNDATNAAGQYETQARRALTQADGVKVSLEQMKDLGRQVAKEIPAAFADMQPALYTIFSTIDTNLPGAAKLLREFSKAAVAGQTDVNTATEGGLQAMNAFGLGIKGVTRVNDVLFQLVRKGVGTYEQFVSSLGKAGPSAKRAGQDIETLAGMMAFLTRNGLSTSMAATSAGRAFDLISNSKVDKRLQDFGVAVRDANGEFRPMGDIITDLGKKMADFTAPERAAALEKLFKGSGNNVQARRFFDLAIPGFQQLNSLTGSMRNSAGAMDSAYKIMFDSPQAKVQLLTNKYEAMKTEIGDQLLPMKLKLLEVLSKLLGWWENLSPTVQKVIIIFAAAASGLAVLIGIITMVAGVILVLNGALILFGTTLAAVLWPVTLVIAAIIAIGAAVWAVIHYWDDIVAATKTAWGWIVDKFHSVVDAVTGFFSSLWADIKGIWTSITDWISNAVSTVGNAISNFFSALPGVIGDFFKNLPNMIAYALGFLVGSIIKLFIAIGVAAVKAGVDLVQWFKELPAKLEKWAVHLAESFIVWAATMAMNLANGFINKATELIIWIQGLPARLKNYFVDLARSFLQWGIDAIHSLRDGAADGGNSLLDWFKQLPVTIANFLVGLPAWFRETGLNILRGFLEGIISGWNTFWNWVKGLFDSFINGVKDALGIHSPSTVFAEIGIAILQGLLNGLIAMATAVWNFLKSIVTNVINIFSGSVSWLYEHGRNFLVGLWNGARAGWNSLWSFLSGLPGQIGGIFAAAGSWLLDAGRNLLEGLWNGIKNAAGWLIGKIKDWAGGVLNSVKSFFGIGSPSKIFADYGHFLMQGMANGIDRGSVRAVESAVNAAGAITDAFNSNVGLQDPSFSAYAEGYINPQTGGAARPPASNTTGGSTSGPVVPITIYTNEINPLQHAAELGDALANRVG